MKFEDNEEEEDDDDKFEELQIVNYEMSQGADLRADVFKKKQSQAGPRDMNAPELIEELEEFF